VVKLRRKVRTGVALALGVAAFGCLDALAPGREHRSAQLGIVPLFEGVAAEAGIPGDVDSIVITVHNPPAPDTVIGLSITPGQDSIVFSVDVPMDGAAVDTIAFGLVAMRHVAGPPPRLDTLYRADSIPLVVRLGQPSLADTLPVRYVGPGRDIASIAIDPASVALKPGDSLRLAFMALDSAGGAISDMPALWGSRDRSVAGVGALGTVRAGSEGTTWVVVTAAARGSVKDSARVVVSSAPQILIELAPASATFTAAARGANPAPQAVQVTAGGSGTLGVLSLGRIEYGGGQAAEWLSVSLNRSTAPATIALAVSTAGLAPGTYTATVPVASVLAANSPQRVTATFVVTPVPAIGFGSAAASFIDTVTTSDPAAQTIPVTNAGTGTLSGLAVGTISYTSGSGWLTATLDRATAPATLTLSVAKGAMPAGVYTATVPVTAAAGNSPRTVTVTYDLRPQGAIGLTPQAVTFVDTMTTADPAVQTVVVSNAGTGTLSGLAVGTVSYGVGQPTGWLTANLVGGTTAPDTLTLSVTKVGLSPGVYSATVPVTSAAANNTPQTVTVTFDVRPMPLVGLAPAAVTFTDTVLTSDPAARTVAVTNAGTGTLNGLAVGAIDYASGSGWLTATLDQSTAPATLTLSVAKGTLAAGTYTATVPVTAGFAGNAPSVTVTFVVLPSPLVSMLVLPGFFVLQPADTLRFYVLGYNATGGSTPTPGLRFTSRAPAVAAVDSLTGRVTGVAPGTAVILMSAPGASGPVLDSALIAVPTGGQAVAFAAATFSSFATARVGDTVDVLVGVYLGAVSGEKLGSYVAQLSWTPGVLHYVSTAAVPTAGFAAPLPDTTNAGSGQLLFSASDTTGMVGPAIGLAHVRFVATSTTTGPSPVGLALTDLTAASTFTNLLPGALVLSASIQVK
jgi:hypothetical protein